MACLVLYWLVLIVKMQAAFPPSVPFKLQQNNNNNNNMVFCINIIFTWTSTAIPSHAS